MQSPQERFWLKLTVMTEGFLKMEKTDAREFMELLDAVAPVYRMEMGAPTKKLWLTTLAMYSMRDIAQAFAEHLRKEKFAPTPASVIAMIDKINPDGRLGADEAWAMIPRDEYKSAVLTSEMMEAMRFAQPLLDEGDQVAARMAFKEAYTTLVDEARRNGIPPHWFASLGQDKEGRESVLAEAVRKGRISSSQASGLLPPQKVEPMLRMASVSLPILELKQVSSEVREQNLKKLREVIGKFSTKIGVSQ